MSNISKLIILSTFGVLTACSKPGIEVTAQQYGEKWPFKVSSGNLECKGQAVIFHTDEKAYAVNGVAKQKGYKDIEPIWKQDPKFFEMANEIAKSENKPVRDIIRAMGRPTKINIGPILDEGLKLCK
ncbi:DUF2511 domain-containing protein [Pseudomonas sp. TMP9]|uniref:DUF2511 domain-containing protein n=1 Tax=Pseudomonas sp. TMP9 TaxID=3133144 RepID=UPI0030D316D2